MLFHAYERLIIAEKLNMTGRSIVLTNPDLSRKSCQDTLQIILTQKTSLVNSRYAPIKSLGSYSQQYSTSLN